MKWVSVLSLHPHAEHVVFPVPEVYLIDEEDGRAISEKHYKPGSTIELHCIVNNYLPEFKEVRWTHAGKVITESSERGGVR